VVETPVGRLGSLICWEHWMPLVRHTLHEAGEDLHVALWPAVREMHQIASRHYAFEGRCFVLAAGAIMRARDLPLELERMAQTVGAEEEEVILSGGSAVIGPDGLYVAGPTFGSEVILLARLHLDRIREESLTLDVTGHFHRPDLFRPDLLRFDSLPSGSPEKEDGERDHTGSIRETDPLRSSGTDGAPLRVLPAVRSGATGRQESGDDFDLDLTDL
jgi:hypothetical protein